MTTQNTTKSASNRARNYSYRNLIEVLRRAPLMSDKEIYNTYHFSKSVVTRAKQALKEQGFDCKAIGRAIVQAYFERNPDVSHKQAAKELRTTVSNINWLRRLYCEEQEDKREIKADAVIVHALRPVWYVVEYLERGYLGVNLREDEFKRYLELYEYKRLGIHSPIIDKNPYR